MPVVPNLFLTVAQFNAENFPLPIFQSIAQLQYSDILRSVCNLQKKDFGPVTASFCNLCDDFREKGGHRTSTNFLNLISNFPNSFGAHRKMLLWPTG